MPLAGTRPEPDQYPRQSGRADRLLDPVGKHLAERVGVLVGGKGEDLGQCGPGGRGRQRIAEQRTTCPGGHVERRVQLGGQPCGDQLTPDPPSVVLLAPFDLDEYVFDGLLAGGGEFCSSTPRRKEIVLAVSAAATGDALISPGPMRRLVEHFVRWSATTGEDRMPLECGGLLLKEVREPAGGRGQDRMWI
jgi:hypothetical protein